jgi:hypothetical protein
MFQIDSQLYTDIVSSEILYNIISYVYKCVKNNPIRTYDKPAIISKDSLQKYKHIQ